MLYQCITDIWVLPQYSQAVQTRMQVDPAADRCILLESHGCKITPTHTAAPVAGADKLVKHLIIETLANSSFSACHHCTLLFTGDIGC